MKNLISISFILLILGGICFAQVPPEVEMERKRDSERLKGLENQRPPRPKPIGFYNKKLTKEQRERLNPSKEDLAKYEDFLKTPKANIVKILPYLDCSRTLVNINDTKCVEVLPIFGNGSFYSFYEKSHENYSKSNISFLSDNFRVAFRSGLSGLIFDMGKLDLNSVTLNTKELKVLIDIPPAEFLQQNPWLNQDYTINGQNYKVSVPAKPNHVYIMRTINKYRARHLSSFYDYYDDITIVFQVVKQDSEGAITLIWKELKREDSTKINSAARNN